MKRRPRRYVPPLVCGVCEGRHLTQDCPWDEQSVSPAPLETPSHNGAYLGPAPVRVIPPGVSGEGDYASRMRAGSQRGVAKRWQGHQRARPPAKTHCIHGHLLDEANTAYYGKSGRRRCRTCSLLQQQAYLDRKKARDAKAAS